MSKKNREQQNHEMQVAGEGEHAVEGALQGTQESLDTVRDILFGSQMRDHDSRFASLEGKLESGLAAFREEMKESLSKLQGFVETELRVLSERVASEASLRTEALHGVRSEAQTAQRGLSERLESMTGAIEKRIVGLDQQHASADAAIRKQVGEQVSGLRGEFKADQASLQQTVERLVGELNSGKTDRTALATMLHEMAAKLQG